MELWSGFFGNIIGALIGGLIAYLIVLIQLRSLRKQQEVKEKLEKEEKEIQLLWQIYFDIKKDCENSKLWDKYEELLRKGEDIIGTHTAEYINETLQFLMRDIRNFFKLLHGKESEINGLKFNELCFLWERAAQLLIFMFKIYDKFGRNTKNLDTKTFGYYTEANDLYQIHGETVRKKQ